MLRRPAADNITREATMKNLKEKFQKFLRDEEGATAVEYAVMVALIIVVCIVAIGWIGTGANQAFTTVANSLPGSGATGS